MVFRRTTGQAPGVQSAIGFVFEGDPTGVQDSTAAVQDAIDDNALILIPAGTYRIGQITHTGASRTIRALGPVTIIQTDATGVFAFKGGWDLLGTVSSFATASANLVDAGESSVTATVSVLTLAASATVAKGDILKVVSDDINPYGRAALVPKMGEYSLAGLSSTGTTVTLANILVEPYATNIRLVRLQNSTFTIEGDITFDTDPAIRDTNVYGAVASFRSAKWCYIGDGVKFFNSVGRAIDNSAYRSTFDGIIFRNLANRPTLNQYGYGVQDGGWQTVMRDCHGENLRHLYSEGSGTLNMAATDYDRYGGGWYAQVSDCSGMNCQAQVFDTHGTAYGVVFSDCRAIGSFSGAVASGSGFAGRGRNVTFRDCTTDACHVGFNLTGTGARAENCTARRTYYQALQIVGDTSDATGITTITGIVVEGGLYENLAVNECAMIGADGFNITARLNRVRMRMLSANNGARGFYLTGTGTSRVDMKDVVVDFENATGTGTVNGIHIAKDTVTLRCDGLKFRGGSAPYTSCNIVVSGGASAGNGADVEVLGVEYQHASVVPTPISAGITKGRVSYLGTARFPARAFGVSPSNPDNTAAFTAAMTTIAGQGGGTLVLEDGTYVTGLVELWDTVSIVGESRKGTRIKLKNAADTSLIVSRDFAGNVNGAGATAWGTVNAPKNFRIAHLTLDGNAVNQSVPGVRADWRDNNYLLKLWAFHFWLDDIDFVDAREGALYTEHTSAWETTFNQYAFGESKFSNLYMKNYWQVGWVNRGSHDSTIADAIMSSYNASGADASYGYIQQGSANYGAQGCIARNLHVWGEHSANGVYLDSSNIISGWVYAEGCDAAAIKLVNSTSNNFDAFVGYCTDGVELFSGNNNHVRAFVESNVSGALFKLRATSGSVLEQLPGNNPTGAIFDVTTGGGNYTGGNNVLISARPYAPSALITGTPHASDRLQIQADAASDANDSTWHTWPMGASKVELKKNAGSANGTLDLGLTELIAAGARVAITAKTGAYTLTDQDYAVTASASGGAFSITLPTAVGRTGKLFEVKKTDSSANAVTVATTSSQTIDGVTTHVLSAQYAYVLVQSDGANWQILARTSVAASADVMGFNPRTGGYLQPSNMHTSAVGTPTTGRALFMPIDVGASDLTLQSLSVNVTTFMVIGSGDPVYTLGIYADDGTGGAPLLTAPGLLFSGTIDPSTSNGAKHASTSIVLSAGRRYWSAFLLYQTVAPSTAAVFSCLLSTNSLWSASASVPGAASRALLVTGQTALPTTSQTFAVTASTEAPVVCARAA